MKHLFLVLVLVPTIALAQQKFSFQLIGDIGKVMDPAHRVSLNYMADGKRVFDTAVIRGGKFSFHGKLAEPTRGNLRLLVDSAEAARKGLIRTPAMQRDYLTVFLDKGIITVTTVDSFSNSMVAGSATHAEYARLQEQLKPINQEYQKLSQQYSALYRAKDTAGMNQLEPQFTTLEKKMQDINGAYVTSNPQSPYAVFALNVFAGYDMDPVAVEPLFKLLPQNVQLSASGKDLANRIAIAKKTGIGMYALDFTQNDTAEVPVKLSSFRGKYVLLDFWASWCGPCRAENPNVVRAFQKYRDKGFTVLGVSLDRPGQKEKWLKAIHDDNLTWTHVSDLKFWDNEVAKQYGIQAIPQNYLLDADGKIVAKSIRGEELDKKLQELLK